MSHVFTWISLWYVLWLRQELNLHSSTHCKTFCNCLQISVSHSVPMFIYLSLKSHWIYNPGQHNQLSSILAPISQCHTLSLQVLKYVLLRNHYDAFTPGKTIFKFNVSAYTYTYSAKCILERISVLHCLGLGKVHYVVNIFTILFPWPLGIINCHILT